MFWVIGISALVIFLLLSLTAGHKSNTGIYGEDCHRPECEREEKEDE
jgi:hypothetical protein